MKRIFGVLMVAGLVLTGCKDEKNGNKDGGGGTDMKVSGGDMSTNPKAATGEPCTKNADCAGNLCITETMGVFKGGYCSKSCTASTQCGEDTCYPLSSTQNACLKHCVPKTDSDTASPADCRADYACWTDGVCLPPAKDYFLPEALCNPTTTTNPNCSSSEFCLRIEHTEDGSGADKGICLPTCNLGVGTCGPEDQCVLKANSTVVTADFSGTYDGDKGVYTACLNFTLGADAIDNGGACTAESSGGTANPFAFACVDGSQCALPADARYYSDDTAPDAPGGDSKCYTLCYQAGHTPVLGPDAGVPGTPFTACPGGTTCKDTFGLFNNTVGNAKVGLCQP